jgi:dodecin
LTYIKIFLTIITAKLILWRRSNMESVYKVVDIIGTSEKSWEDAAKLAVTTAAKTLRDLRVAEVRRMDMKIEEGKLVYRVKMNVSFKYED